MTNHTLRRFAALLVVPAALTVTLTACGGGGRPSVDDLTQKLVDIGDGKLTHDQAECAAKVYVDSDLSDDVLKKIMKVKNVDDFDNFDEDDISDKDEKAADDIEADLEKCAG